MKYIQRDKKEKKHIVAAKFSLSLGQKRLFVCSPTASGTMVRYIEHTNIGRYQVRSENLMLFFFFVFVNIAVRNN